MINKIISGTALALVIGLSIYSYLQDLKTTRKIEAFINAGPRFTLDNGYELCEAVRVIALHSIGFQQSGLALPDCDKYLKTDKPIPDSVQANSLPDRIMSERLPGLYKLYKNSNIRPCP